MSPETAQTILNGLQATFFIVLAIGAIGMFYTAMMHAFIGLPYVKTLKLRFPYIFDEIERQGKLTPDSVFVDLGSGLGHILFEAERRGFQHLIGYEISPWHLFWSKVAGVFKRSQVQFLMKDFLKADLSNVDVFYFFLTPKAIATVAPKIFKEGKKGALVIALGDQIVGKDPIKVITTPKPEITIYFYRLP